MTENDIKGYAQVIAAGLLAKTPHSTPEEKAIFDAGVALATNLLVDINRIADALSWLAQTSADTFHREHG